MSLLYYYTVCLSIIQRLLQYNYIKIFFKDCDFITEEDGRLGYNKDGKQKRRTKICLSFMLIKKISKTRS